MIGDYILAITGGLVTGWWTTYMLITWRRRPLVVWSDVLGRWVASRSRARFEDTR